MSGEAFDLCICSFPRWRHPKNEADRKVISWSTNSKDQPHHLFIEPADPPDIVRFQRLPNGRLARLGAVGEPR